MPFVSSYSIEVTQPYSRTETTGIEPVHGGEADEAASPQPAQSGHRYRRHGFLIRTSVVLVPSAHRVAAKYLKLVTSSSFLPFMVMSAVMFIIIFDFPCYAE